ncbi:MAG: hypothetical protein KC561_06225 [Myxococcales bacterium]|nr:hypothetical protein [Myxococcales bacterium]
MNRPLQTLLLASFLSLIGPVGVATADEAESLPTHSESEGSTLAPAEAAIETLRERVGDPYDFSEVGFTFVVEREGAEVVRRSHLWRPQEGTISVSDGVSSIVLDVSRRDPSAWTANPEAFQEEWESVSPGTPPAEAAQAWTGFINDSFWLFAPAKLAGSGAEVAVNGQTISVTFPSGGVTPGDSYEFDLNPETGLVDQWSFVLVSGREGSFSWTDYLEVSGLWVSTQRTSADGSTVIRFEDVRASR